MDKKDIISLLEDIALCLELLKENPFKFSSYSKAARFLERYQENVIDLIQNKKLDTLPGFGKAITEKIYSFFETGISYYLEELKSKIPSGIFDILTLKGIGVKKTLELWHQLGITNPVELEYACNENRLVSLSGFGKKTQDNVLSEIQNKKKYSGYFLYSEGMREAGKIMEELAKVPEIRRFQLVGDLRRGVPVADEIVLIVETEENSKINIPQSIYRVKFIEAGAEEFIHQVFVHTGSQEHVLSAGFQADNYFSEKEIYEKAKLRFIEPELRENCGELQVAAEGDLPRLIQKDDIRGIIHAHTTYSDGANTLEEMVLGCLRYGYEYLAVSDHSQSAVYAGGLKPEAILRQKKEIEELNSKYKPFKIFHGIESDILENGNLDYPDELLKEFDFVIASVHSRFNMSQADMTERLVRAVRNPYTTILGHLTGRLLLGREAYQLDMEKVINECIENNTVIEINANPHRLDMDWKYLKGARNIGALFSINPDAHSISGISDVQYGLITARKGWLESKHVINSMSTEEISVFFKRKIHG